MNQNLSITIIQSDLKWQDKIANRNYFGKLLEKTDKKSDLIILPEMFTTGFSMNSKVLAETMDGDSISWMKNVARSLDSVIIGSLIIEENRNYYNRLLWVYPDGNVLKYDKRHLFRMAEENKYYAAGNLKLIVEYKAWKICPLVCYDLRFPVWCRNQEDFDMLIFIANWPEKRNQTWKTLLLARAIENQVYVIGVNRIGTDANDIDYSGDSAIIDPKGNLISDTKPNEESVETVELSLQELNKFRENFPVSMDKDDFRLI